MAALRDVAEPCCTVLAVSVGEDEAGVWRQPPPPVAPDRLRREVGDLVAAVALVCSAGRPAGEVERLTRWVRQLARREQALNQEEREIAIGLREDGVPLAEAVELGRMLGPRS